MTQIYGHEILLLDSAWTKNRSSDVFFFVSPMREPYKAMQTQTES